HHIDNDDRDTLVKQAGALGDKRTPMLRSVLACWADDLNGGYQPAMRFLVVDPRLVDILGKVLTSRPQMNPWLGEIVRRKRPTEAAYDHHRPGRVKAFPMTHVIQGWAEMVTQRHALLLLIFQPTSVRVECLIGIQDRVAEIGNSPACLLADERD